MEKFTFFWLNGKREVFEGTGVADAFTNGGYGAGAMAALDFFAPGDDTSWTWNETEKKWNKEF